MRTVCVYCLWDHRGHRVGVAPSQRACLRAPHDACSGALRQAADLQRRADEVAARARTAVEAAAAREAAAAASVEQMRRQLQREVTQLQARAAPLAMRLRSARTQLRGMNAGRQLVRANRPRHTCAWLAVLVHGCSPVTRKRCC